MKTRQGFVSNSSSSSFIVAFSKMPESADEVKELLFGDRETLCEYEHLGPMSTKTMSEIVFEDMVGQKSKSLKEVYDELNSGWDFKNADGSTHDYNADYSNLKEEDFGKKIGDFADEIEGQLVFIFSYADDDALGSTMEHGGIFDNLTHRRISHH